jgi:hypothetical protein
MFFSHPGSYSMGGSQRHANFKGWKDCHPRKCHPVSEEKLYCPERCVPALRPYRELLTNVLMQARWPHRVSTQFINHLMVLNNAAPPSLYSRKRSCVFELDIAQDIQSLCERSALRVDQGFQNSL